MDGRRWTFGAAVGLAAGPAAAGAVACAFYLAGNGPVPGAIALGSVPIGFLVAPGLALGGRARPACSVALATLLVGDLAFVGVRRTALREGPPFALHVDGVPVGAPWLAGLVREDESVFAGNALVEALGMLDADSRARFDAAAADEYARLAGRLGGPGVNALLLRSTPARVSSVVWMPPGDAPVPAIVYLHGFGGLLTPYVAAATEAPELARHAIVAPALDVGGQWWTDEGLAVVRRTLDTLPARIDRDHVVLVGLSNGGVGACAVAADPELAPRLRGVVALMGAEADFGRARVPMLVVAAERDDRFELESLYTVGEALGAELAVVPGDHFAVFTETESVNAALVAWLADR